MSAGALILGPGVAAPGTAAQHALTALRERIGTGELASGRRIGQEQIAELLGVSVAPVREALRILEREGQVTYRPRRGYVVTELNIADLEEIYGLRALLEREAVLAAWGGIEEEDACGIEEAARDCEEAVRAGDIIDQLAANRRFHLAILEPCRRPHLLRLINLLWDGTEAYRALYYNDPSERGEALAAHARILAALDRRGPERLITELDAHREKALVVLRRILAPPADGPPLRAPA